MAVIFVLVGPGNGFSPPLGADAWSHDFDGVTDSPLETVIVDYDVVIPADQLRQAPRLLVFETHETDTWPARGCKVVRIARLEC